MKHIGLVALSAFLISGCGGSDNSTASVPIMGAANPATESGGSVRPDSSALVPIENNTADLIEPEVLSSQIAGNVTLLSSGLPVGDVNVNVTGTEVTSLIDANGDYSLELPVSDVERRIMLDITGDEIISHRVEAAVPRCSG